MKPKYYVRFVTEDDYYPNDKKEREENWAIWIENQIQQNKWYEIRNITMVGDGPMHRIKLLHILKDKTKIPLDIELIKLHHVHCEFSVKTGSMKRKKRIGAAQTIWDFLRDYDYDHYKNLLIDRL